MVTTTVKPTYTPEQAENDIAVLRGQVDALNEVLQQFNGPVPNTPSAGGYDLFAQGGQPNYINAQGLQMGLVGAQNATFPGTVVTAAALTNIATATYPANDAEAGAVYELEVWGNGVQGTTKQTLEFGVAFGGTAMTNITFGTTAFEAVSQAFRWRCVARVICHTTGATGTWTSYLLGFTTDFNSAVGISPGNANEVSGFSCESTTTTTKDTTASQTFALQAAWGAVTGAPTLTSTVAMFKRLA